jgi:hypothetical protein
MRLEGHQRLAGRLGLRERPDVGTILTLKREDVARGLRWAVFLVSFSHDGLAG